MGPDDSADDTWVIDAHCHAASLDFTPQSFIDGAVDNLVVMIEACGLRPNRAQLVQRVVAQMQDEFCDELVAEMDAARIEKSVLLIPDFTVALPDSRMSLDEMFLRHHAIARRHPGRFEIFGGVDPRRGKSGVDMFERAVVELGFAGLKIYPPCGYSPSDPSLFPFYEVCQHHRIPVLMHIGPTSSVLDFELARPGLVDVAARTFKDVDFILAHAAISHTEDCLQLCRFRPNVYLDISGYQQDGAGGEGLASVTRMIHAGISHKVLFGTDWPVFRDKGSQRTFRAYLEDAGGPFDSAGEQQRNLIMRGNITRLLAKRRSTSGGAQAHPTRVS
jgi:uncharacterized protein